MNSDKYQYFLNLLTYIVEDEIVNGFSNLSIGIMQLIMGIVSSIDIHSIFLLFIVLGFLTILSLGLRILWNEERESVTEEDSFWFYKDILIIF